MGAATLRWTPPALQATNIPISARTPNAARGGAAASFSSFLVLSRFNKKFCQSEGQEDISQEQNDRFALPGVLIWIQA